MRRTPRKTFTVHHMTGEGATVAEAKQNALALVDAALAGSHEPEIINFRGQSMLIWREPDGWRYVTIAEGGSNPERMPTYRPPTEPDLDTCRRKALHHLAQLTWIPADLTEVPAVVTDERDRRELVSYFRFQLAYRYWRDEMGKTDNEAHRMAFDHEREGVDGYGMCITARAENVALNSHAQYCAECAKTTPHCHNGHCPSHGVRPVNCGWCQARTYAERTAAARADAAASPAEATAHPPADAQGDAPPLAA